MGLRGRGGGQYHKFRDARNNLVALGGAKWGPTIVPARMSDAAEGYHWFLQSRGTLTRDQINALLLRSGRRPIAQRTYDHYTRLLKAGQETYVPINQFDVERALHRKSDAGAPPRMGSHRARAT